MAVLTGAFPLATETNVSLDSYIPLVWGQKVNEFYRNKLVAAPFFTDRSDEVSEGGDTLYTPNTTEFTANSKTTGAPVTLNSNSDTKQTLSINNWFESSFAIEDAEAAQVKRSYSLMERYSKNCGYAIAKKLDTAIVTNFQSFTNTVGSSTNNLGDSDIRAAFAYLETTGVDIMEASFFVSPNVFWKQIQAIDKFSLAINSPINDPTAKVPAAYLYGRPVHVTAQITLNSTPSGGRSNALAVPDAIHWATSPLGAGGSKSPAMVGTHGIRVQSNYIPEYLSTVTTADVLYGTVLNRATGGVQILTAS
jgi:predicted lipoprotein